MTNASTADTIVARATPAGRGGVAIIRISGPGVSTIATGMLTKLPQPRSAEFMEFKDGSDTAIDAGLALYFPAPHSYTGEDVLELHSHGSPVICDMLVERSCDLGARLAEPGEFSQRAFLNDKMDLTQAEAVADLIDSASRTAARAATRSLQGDFAALVHQLNDRITELRVHVEAAIDFPEEEIDFLSDKALHARLDTVTQEFSRVEKTVQQGCLLRDGATVVIVGRPNAGKSLLLNALAGYDAAIVTAIEGTTRDLVREQIDLQGGPVRIFDTAGLRESIDEVEVEGIRRAQHALKAADHALVVVDAVTITAAQQEKLLQELPADLSCTVVRNKLDLSDDVPGLASDSASEARATLAISALTGAGVNDLRDHLLERLGYVANDGAVTARRRHLQSLAKAQEHFVEARRLLIEASAGELMADELLQVQNALAEITGQFSSDDLLGEIFSSFCIGK